MKINLIYYVKKYKNIIFFISFILLSIYSLNSISVIYSTFQKSNHNAQEYDWLNKKNEEILNEISDLEFKTQGLREETLNKDLLETQLKTHLNKSKVKEFVILH